MKNASFAKHCWLVFSIILTFFSVTFAQEAFDIDDYHVDIAIQSNGSCKITERITVDFHEKRRGIFRKLPFRYHVQPIKNGPKAIREDESSIYEILIKDISVPNFQYQEFEEGDYLKIRIGDPDKYVKGVQTYTINYTVWGAINDFGEWTEFSWNVIGNEWDNNISKASYKITLPKASSLKKEDLLVFTGELGSKATNATISQQGNTIQGNTTTNLSPYEGMTVSARFPKGFFTSVAIPVTEYAKQYYIKKHFSRININSDASIDVEENYQVVFTKPTSQFIRAIDNSPFADSHNQQKIVIDEQDVYLKVSPNANCNFHIVRSDENDQIQIRNNAQPFSGEHTFNFKYKIWGAIVKENETNARINWDLLSTLQDEPVLESTFEVISEKGIPIVYTPQTVHPKGKTEYNDLKNITQNELPRKVIGGLENKLLHGGHYELKLLLESKNIDFSKVPLSVYAKYFTIKDYQVEAHLQRDGGVRMKYQIRPQFLYKENKSSFQPIIMSHLHDDYLYSKTPNRSLLSAHNQFLITNIKTPNNVACTIEKDDDFGQKIIITDPNWNVKTPIFEYEYTIYGLVNDAESGNNLLQIPLVFHPTEPIEQSSFNVYYPEGVNVKNVKLEALLNGEKKGVITENSASYTRGIAENHLAPNQILSIKLLMPEASMGGLSWSNRLSLAIHNNIWYIIGLIGAAGFWLIWFLFGKDEKPTIMVHFQAPKDITPAEAGYLFDEKLHKKDLISLIFYWANKGYLSIKELPDKEYELTKKQELPVTSRQFEKTFFNGLFADSNPVAISSLRNKFYRSLQQSFTDMYRHSRDKGMFVKGSFTLQKIITALGVFLLILSIITFLLGKFMWDDLSISIGFFLTGIAATIFGWLMPKKGSWGVEKYAETMGFYEFVKTAEIDRLKVLVKDNPKYFEETIAYAIVFGMGKEWASRFKDLEIPSPDWYQGSTTYPMFNSILFTNNMMDGMRRINDDLSYIKPQTQSGSGGSTFTGGGGFSGGGFGGGGGGSW